MTRINRLLGFLLLYPAMLTAIEALNDGDIYQIYNSYVKVNQHHEYQMRYVPFPLHKNTLPWRWEGKDLPRIIALLEFERFVLSNNITCEKGLGINGLDDPEWFYVSPKTLTKTDYSIDPVKYNLYTLDLPENDFDFVMINQTLEHTYDPIRALENVYKFMRKGGILYINVPANNIPHSTPFHYYTGYTPVGLGAVVKAAGFKILSIGQWGNTDYLRKLFETNSWPDYRQFSNPGQNEFSCPVITWIFAQK